MPDDDLDPRLRRLLSDAVSDVEPRDALPELRAALRSADSRPHLEEIPMARSSARRSSVTYAVTGALLAAAAIAAVFMLFGPVGGNDPGPAAGGTAGEGRDKPSTAAADGKNTPSPVATADPTQEPQADTEEVAAVYYVGDTPGGPRLFREFRRVEGEDELDRALALLQTDPLDPDYLKLWPDGSLEDAVYDGEVINVAITSPEYRTIPADVDEARARAAVESVIFTLQGAVQERAPVQFRLEGNPVDQVYGVPTSEPLANGEILEVLSHMSVTEPADGSTAAGTLTISGVANSFEANVQWRIVAAGGKVVDDGFVTAEGWMGPQLFPWSDTVDVSQLEPGAYTFVAQTDDPSGGAEGPGPAVDTKRFTIR